MGDMGGVELPHEDVPQPGHPSTKIGANPLPDEKTVSDFMKAGPPKGVPRWKGERIQYDK